jgi:RimJ/RimL family protein N-acetyltransferase
MTDALPAAERVTLRDGTQVTFRQARPEDRERFERAFAALDRETVYTRFFTYRSGLSEAEYARLAKVADPAHEAILVATVEGPGGETIVGSGRYIACAPACDPPTAEVAFTIEEDYQGRGIAGRLLEQLVALARRHGIARFEAVVLERNKSMLRVFERSGLPATTRREEDTVVLTLTL